MPSSGQFAQAKCARSALRDQVKGGLEYRDEMPRISPLYIRGLLANVPVI
jgi:hypothetical protein